MTSSERTTDSIGEAAPNERELQNLQRLAMVGTLASGLGHDLRNVVMPVLLRLDVLAASPSIPDSARGDLSAIRQSVLHLQRLAGGLRLLSSDSRERSEVQFTRIGPWWEEVCPLVVDALAANTLLKQDVSSALPDVAVPPSALAQVMMNLAMNARGAMDEHERPVLHVHGRRDGDEVLIAVSDNGIGMDAETRERCFDPFFTTRPRELSTGLGLSTARALLKSHGGELAIASTKEDHGSTFVMHLPLHRAPPASARQGDRTVRFLVRDLRQLAVLRLIARQRGFVEWTADRRESPDFIVGDPEAIMRLRDDNAVQKTIGAATQLIAVGPTDATTQGLPGLHRVDARNLAAFGDLLR